VLVNDDDEDDDDEGYDDFDADADNTDTDDNDTDDAATNADTDSDSIVSSNTTPLPTPPTPNTEFSTPTDFVARDNDFVMGPEAMARFLEQEGMTYGSNDDHDQDAIDNSLQKLQASADFSTDNGLDYLRHVGALQPKPAQVYQPSMTRPLPPQDPDVILRAQDWRDLLQRPPPSTHTATLHPDTVNLELYLRTPSTHLRTLASTTERASLPSQTNPTPNPDNDSGKSTLRAKLHVKNTPLPSPCNTQSTVSLTAVPTTATSLRHRDLNLLTPTTMC
jgi:hypothetical protein